MFFSDYRREEVRAMWKKISLLRMIIDPRHWAEYPWFIRFLWWNKIGQVAPDFELPLARGGKLRLSELRGRPVAFMFVALTCPPAMIQVKRWAALREQFSENQVALFLIYSRERHPGEPGYREFHHTRTDGEKMANARKLSQETDLPVLVDGVDEKVLELYGKVPNPAFVIDSEGRLAFFSTWADASGVEAVLKRLVVAAH